MGDPPMRRSTLALLVLVPVLVIPFAVRSSLAQTVKADYDKQTDFKKYKSFAFRKGTPAPTPFAQERLEAAIANQLKMRGMSQTETPDILVFTHTELSKEQRMDATTFGYGGYPG